MRRGSWMSLNSNASVFITHILEHWVETTDVRFGTACWPWHNWTETYRQTIFCERCSNLWRLWAQFLYHDCTILNLLRIALIIKPLIKIFVPINKLIKLSNNEQHSIKFGLLVYLRTVVSQCVVRQTDWFNVFVGAIYEPSFIKSI